MALFKLLDDVDGLTDYIKKWSRKRNHILESIKYEDHEIEVILTMDEGRCVTTNTIRLNRVNPSESTIHTESILDGYDRVVNFIRPFYDLW